MSSCSFKKSLTWHWYSSDIYSALHQPTKYHTHKSCSTCFLSSICVCKEERKHCDGYHRHHHHPFLQCVFLIITTKFQVSWLLFFCENFLRRRLIVSTFPLTWITMMRMVILIFRAFSGGCTNQEREPFRPISLSFFSMTMWTFLLLEWVHTTFLDRNPLLVKILEKLFW